jgi:hypothetical protein
MLHDDSHSNGSQNIGPTLGTLIVLEAVMEKTSPASCRASDEFPKNSPGAKELFWITANFLFGPVASWMFVADKPREAS